MKERREGTYCPKCKQSLLCFEPVSGGKIKAVCTAHGCNHEFDAQRYMDYVLSKVKAGQTL